MTGALVGAVSCGRCGAGFRNTPFCTRCGVFLVPATTGSIVGTYSGMLAGVYSARAGRRGAAAAIDVVPILLAGVVALVLGASGAMTGLGALITFAALSVIYLVILSIAYSAYGRSLGRLALGLRTVDDLTGDPVSIRRAIRQLGSRHWFRRTVTADLRRGRDPISLARPPVAAASIAVDHDLARGGRIPDDRPAGHGDVAFAESVALVLDTGDRFDVHGAILVGRAPENREGESNLLVPWPDLSRTLSKTHALLEWSGTVLWVTDLHSTNGSALVSPAGERQPLAPGLRGAAAVGWTVELGHRSLEVRPSSVRVS